MHQPEDAALAKETTKECASSRARDQRTCTTAREPFSALLDGLFEESSVLSACFCKAVTCCSNSEIWHSAVAALCKQKSYLR